MHGIFPSFVSARLGSFPSIDITSPVTSEADSSHVTSAALKRKGDKKGGEGCKAKGQGG